MAAVVLAALATVPLAAGSHSQPSDGGGAATLSFTHKGGNEWWVELRLAGDPGGLSVSSRDDGGPWVAMSLRDWGNWAASYHIEPGHRVQFKAVQASTGSTWTSCWFTHPAGAEQCGTTPPPPPPPGTFDATFTGVRGNEWWIQANVATNGPTIAKVEVTLDGGATFKPLAKQSWGAWAASYRIAQGTVVQLRATSGTGAVDLSDCHQWIPPSNTDAAKVACGSAPPPPPSSFTATFTGVKGNAWWIEASVSASKPLAGVDARVDGGTWVPMKHQSWGAWAVSTHAPQGSLIQFRARATDGSYGFAPNGWVWTGATTYPADWHTEDLRASFHNVKGNAGWVQANVYAWPDKPLSKVEARVGAGTWQPLQRQSYGDWAAPLAVPSGATVQFQACAGSACDQSGSFTWPPSPPPAWPVRGVSFVKYHVEHGSGSPGGDYFEEYEGTATFRFTSAGTWHVQCDGVRHRFDNWSGFDNHTYTPVRETASFAPPIWPTAPKPNQELDGFVVVGCARDSFHTKVLDTWSTPAHRNGAPVDVPDWHAYYGPCPCAGYEASWAQRNGLLLSWWFGGRASGMSGELLDTDAPVN